MEMSSRRELDLFLVINGINSEDPYRVFTWKVTYGDIYLLVSLLYRCLPTSTSSMPVLPFYTSAPTTFGLSKVNRKIANESNSPSGFYVFTLLFDCNLLSPIFGLTSSLSSLVLMAMSIIPMFNGATFLQFETRNDLCDVFNDLKGRRFCYTKALATRLTSNRIILCSPRPIRAPPHCAVGSFENLYIPENPRTPKPLTFSKTDFGG
ncbi:hypothetical protein LXL04_030291 [Taraxacum kok-saghyz]